MHRLQTVDKNPPLLQEEWDLPSSHTEYIFCFAAHFWYECRYASTPRRSVLKWGGAGNVSSSLRLQHYVRNRKIWQVIRAPICTQWDLNQSASLRLYIPYLILGVESELSCHVVKLRKSLLPPFCLFVRPHGTTPIPLDGFSWRFTSENFWYVCREN
jgi:hypothetical protein